MNSIIFLILMALSFAMTPSEVAGLGKRISDDHVYEKECEAKGWQKLTVFVGGYPRTLLWKGPEGPWLNGAIIALHGGGGSSTNFCSGPRLGVPMREFSKLALAEGFAVFSLNSTNWHLEDERGHVCGKRFACIAGDERRNLDLRFIETVLLETIPDLRPASSADQIFMTGISNGGFMTVLAATRFDDKITAFAPVSAGDPYGTYVDCDPNLTPRRNAPGHFIDNETRLPIQKTGACFAKAYPHEKKWMTAHKKGKKPAFKLIYHEGDALVDVSCKKKLHQMLLEHGYEDDGSFVLKKNKRKKILAHFWLNDYNQAIIAFFRRHAGAKQDPGP